jgi:hypothetical protein
MDKFTQEELDALNAETYAAQAKASNIAPLPYWYQPLMAMGASFARGAWGNTPDLDRLKPAKLFGSSVRTENAVYLPTQTGDS